MLIFWRFRVLSLEILQIWHRLELLLKIFANNVSKLLIKLVAMEFLCLYNIWIEGDLIIDSNQRLYGAGLFPGDFLSRSCPSPCIEWSLLYNRAHIIWIIVECLDFLLFLGFRLVDVLIKATLNSETVVCEQIITTVINDFLIDPVGEFHDLILSIHW